MREFKRRYLIPKAKNTRQSCLNRYTAYLSYVLFIIKTLRLLFFQIADNGLTQFSGGLFDRINNLRELDLSENKLTTLPKIIE